MELLANGAVVRITDATKENEGQYQCTASNLAGRVTTLAYLKVNIPPEITLEPSGSIQVKSGQSIQLRCQSSGEPIPEVNWRRADGYPM